MKQPVASPYAAHPFLRSPVAIPHPLPPERVNERDANAPLPCAACGHPLGADLCVPLAMESVPWGRTTRAWVCRVALCMACWRGKPPVTDPASYSPGKLKALVLGALATRSGRTMGKLAADAGLRNTQYLHDFMLSLRDDGEVVCSRGSGGDSQPVWRLASA